MKRMSRKQMAARIKELEKQAESESALVGEICALAHQITMQSRKYYAFIRWSAHVTLLDVTIRPKTDYTGLITQTEVHAGGPNHWDGESIPKLRRLRDNLKYILENDELPPRKNMRVVPRVVDSWLLA